MKRGRSINVRFKAMGETFDMDAAIFEGAEPSQPLVMMVNRAVSNLKEDASECLIDVQRAPWLFKWILYCYQCPGYIPSHKDIGCTSTLWNTELDYWGLSKVGMDKSKDLLENALEKYKEREQETKEKLSIVFNHIIAQLLDICDPTEPSKTFYMALVQPEDKSKWSEAYPEVFRTVPLSLIEMNIGDLKTQMRQMGFDLTVRFYNCGGSCDAHAYAPAVTETLTGTSHWYLKFEVKRK